jgi:hypothetical protein
VVVAGIAASVAMNVLHAPHNAVARMIAAVPPLALFGSMELISRIPSSNKWLSSGRIMGTLAVAGVSGSLSYTSMVLVVERYGWTGWKADIWPIAVDGLMMVATLSLVEVVRKIRQMEMFEPEEIPVSPAPAPPVWLAPRGGLPRTQHWTPDGRLSVLGPPDTE